MSAAIHFESEAYDITHGKPMGRHFAGHGFLSAYVRHSAGERITGFVRNAKSGQHFGATVKAMNSDRVAEYITATNPGALKQVGCLFTPSPINASQAWVREMHGPKAWSLCGVNHTLSSERVMDGITDLLTAPVQPWDAIICTSTASQEVIRRLFARQAEYLSRRLGATRFVVPQLPVIPLGVDCDSQLGQQSHRDAARAELGLHPEDVVVLFLGRLSFHAKANPAPMYLALERVSQRRRIVLIECGWTANDAIGHALADARAKLCPSVRSIVLDGREPAARRQAWASADIFCSLSDNIQETFGLTPIEAMAAGLPVVVTDWDGYKDTVRNGVDGFAVPTLAAPPGAGLSLAARHALGTDTYDTYIGQASTAVAVDIDATADAFERLAADPELRRSMGANGAARAREVFDWQVIVRAYERLWDELAELRKAADPASSPSPRSGIGPWPARPDPFELFASFPSATLSNAHSVTRAFDIDESEVKERIGLKIGMVNTLNGISAEFLLKVWHLTGPEETNVRDILSANQTASAVLTARALVWLAKFGLIRITGQSKTA